MFEATVVGPEQSNGIGSYIERFTSMFQSSSKRIVPPTFPRSNVRWRPHMRRKSYSVSIRQGEVQPPLSTQEETAGKDEKTENVRKDEKTENVRKDEKTENVGKDEKTENVRKDEKTENAGKDEKTENAGKDEKTVFATTEDTVVNSIIQQFAERSRVGLAKYGTTLDREDLDILDWIEHSKQEAMDFVLYLEKLKRVIQEMVSETDFVEENVV